jgi:hypothetical protein
MKTSDALKATYLAFLNVLKTDTRVSTQLQTGVAANWALLNGGGSSDIKYDQLVAQIMKKLTSAPGYY